MRAKKIIFPPPSNGGDFQFNELVAVNLDLEFAGEDFNLKYFSIPKFDPLVSRENHGQLANLMIGGKWNHDTLPAKHSAGIATIRNDYLLRRYDGDDRRGSNRIALRSLKLAPAVRSVDNVTPFLNLYVHSFKAFFHRLFPLHRFIYLEELDLFLHNLMQPILTLESHLTKHKSTEHLEVRKLNFRKLAPKGIKII